MLSPAAMNTHSAHSTDRASSGAHKLRFLSKGFWAGKNDDDKDDDDKGPKGPPSPITSFFMPLLGSFSAGPALA